ncbi:MAG: RelA/spoT family protein [Erysipelotrichia bacterium]|nr:RelA/spoT family protein [Erysipelotrichia bacterium]
MKLELFNKIDETITLLKMKKEDYQQIRKEIKYILLDVLNRKNDMIMDISSRVKSADSLREKIIRNRLYLKYDSSHEILDNLSDLIGLKIECRFIDEERQVFEILKNYFHIKNEDRYYHSEKYPYLKLELDSEQPQMQRNGFTIYRVDGYYERSDEKIRFELQIKSMVNSFWGDIEHKLVYKNTNYYVYDAFMKNLLSSINANLEIVDNQLRIIYDEMENSDRHQMGLVSEENFEKMLAKAINDLFTEKLKMSIGFTINVKNTSDILGHYIFVKNIRDDLGNPEKSTSLFTVFKKINSVDIDFSEEIVMEQDFVCNDPFKQEIGNYLFSQLNSDYEWYVFFQMLFALEDGNNIEDFSLFMEIMKDYIVDNYWFKTSFMKLDMEDAINVQNECLLFLAKSLCEIGTIKIIYNDKLLQIRNIFTMFVEELEKRVISFHDFEHYQEAYYDELKNEISSIF